MGTLARNYPCESARLGDKDGCRSRYDKSPAFENKKSSSPFSGTSTETLEQLSESYGCEEKRNVKTDNKENSTQLSSAFQAVVEMGVPIQYIELANTVHLMVTGREFLQVQDLYLAASDIAESPEKQHNLALKVYQHQNAEKQIVEKLKESPEKIPHCSVKRSESSVASKAADKTDMQQRLRGLVAENRKLKKRKMCRTCQKVELVSSGVTFLPCGHFIVCEECAEKHDSCPACGKTIMGTVRTFLA